MSSRIVAFSVERQVDWSNFHEPVRRAPRFDVTLQVDADEAFLVRLRDMIAAEWGEPAAREAVPLRQLGGGS